MLGFPSINRIVGVDIDEYVFSDEKKNELSEHIGTYVAGKDVLELSNPQTKTLKDTKRNIFLASFVAILASVLTLPFIFKFVKKLLRH